MSALVRAFRAAVTTQHAPSRSTAAIATSSLKASGSTIEAIAQGSVRNTGRIAAVVPLIGGAKIDQKKADSTAKRMGQIRHEAAMLKAIEPHVVRAAKDYADAETSRANMVKAVSGATQKVAALNAQTQAEAFLGHAKAHAQVNYWQHVHGGDNFSV